MLRSEPASFRAVLLLALLVALGGRPAAAQGPAAVAPLTSWTPRLPESRSTIPAAPRDSLPRPIGYQHWKGAAIGASLGAFAGFMLTLLYDNDCADCDKPSHPLAKGALGGAVIGGLIGFVAGLATPRYAAAPAPAGP